MDKLKKLREELKRQKASGFIVPMSDEFGNEFVPAHARRLEWLTGFKGSAGTAIVLANKAVFFTDGRYILQAKKELPKGYELCNIVETSPAKWLKNNSGKKSTIAYDAKLHTENEIRNLRHSASEGGFILSRTENLIDRIWKNKPAASAGKIFVHEIKYSGQHHEEKIKNIAAGLKKTKSDFLILTMPESICWLLNIRGNDLPVTPFVMGYAILTKTGKVRFYVDKKKLSKEVVEHLGKNVSTHLISKIEKDIKKLCKAKTIELDPVSSPSVFFDILHEIKARIIEITDPCILPKACKNKTELKGMKEAHKRDAAAMCNFLSWFYENISSAKHTEISAADKLREFRKEQKLFYSLSFETISASGSNGAIVHYRPDEKSKKKILPDSIYLLDSGAQYYDGTTDITRTLATGKPTKEQRENFTLVLKGHIAIAMAKFPAGTAGATLDGLARFHLWQRGLDYDHGTGHGVGSFLNVHEGPQGINKRAWNVALQPGMIISNEPGYYKTGEYGIRIENLVAVKESSQGETKKFYELETITLVPIDITLIEKSLLTAEEKKWLNDYHARIFKTISPLLNAKAKNWLKKATKKI